MLIIDKALRIERTALCAALLNLSVNEKFIAFIKSGKNVK